MLWLAIADTHWVIEFFCLINFFFLLREVLTKGMRLEFRSLSVELLEIWTVCLCFLLSGYEMHLSQMFFICKYSVSFGKMALQLRSNRRFPFQEQHLFVSIIFLFSKKNIVGFCEKNALSLSTSEKYQRELLKFQFIFPCSLTSKCSGFRQCALLVLLYFIC